MKKTAEKELSAAIVHAIVPGFCEWLTEAFGYIEQPRAEELHQQLQAAIDKHNNAFRAGREAGNAWTKA